MMDHLKSSKFLRHLPTRFFFVFAICCSLRGQIKLVDSHRLLPPHLRECYSDDGIFVPRLPLNLQTVLDVVRKIERRVHSTTSVRPLSAALIQRYKLDGIVYSERLAVRKGVLRYAATGSQRARNRIVQELVPGDTRLVAEASADALSRDERCLLHFALSNTIWDHFDETSEESLCRPPPTEKWLASHAPIGDDFHRSMHPKGPGEDNRCPKESGVVYTKYGTVALGSIVAAVAAGLEPQLVRTNNLLVTMSLDDAPRAHHPREEDQEVQYDDDLAQKSSLADKSTMWLQQFRRTEVDSSAQLDNVWIATVSGDLAEVVINQGPIYGTRVYLGASGFWDDTTRPQAFYVKHPQNNFDFTRAEILGDVDGLIIGKKLHAWVQSYETLRLSQLLDMYFSESGVVFDEKRTRACKRAEEFPMLAPQRLVEEQTYAAAQVLGYLKSVAVMTNQALRRLVNRAVEHFGRYTDQHLFSAVICRSDISGTASTQPPRLELLVAFDGSWTKEYTTKFFAVLVDDFDVSMYGSRMGIIHAQSGQWVLTPTNSPASAHQAINTFKDLQWPLNIDLHAVFNTVLKYLDNSWEIRQKNVSSSSYGQAVVLLATRIQMTDEQAKISLETLKSIKAKYPEIYFLYYTCESKAEIFKPFLLSDEDRIVTTLRIDDISKSLSTVPRSLRPLDCSSNVPGLQLQLEDYVTPSESITYRLHSRWRAKMKTLNVTGVGYGTARVCSWSQWTSTSDKFEINCQDLSQYGDISFAGLNDDCGQNGNCPNTYFQVFNVTANMNCTEFDCKSPNQVRFITRMENFECSASSEKALVNFVLIILCFILVS